LRERYASLNALNHAWGTQFWSQQYGAWDEIELPNRTMTFVNPGQMLDYRRFMNTSILQLFKAETEAIRTAGATQPLFTNMVFGLKWLDQFEWAQHADYTALDVYPDPSEGAHAWISAALAYDLTRSVKGNKPFLLVEQATTQVNWRPINQLKPPGMMRALSFQAVARGADSVMFFQWRASKAGAEKFHSAMVPHAGAAGNRIFDEVARLGAELKQLNAVAGTRVRADVGLLFGFENLWALEIDSKPARLDAVEAILPWHAALATQNIPVDVVHPDGDLSPYRVLVAPLLYQLSEAQAENLRRFVERGGTLVWSYFSGIADEHDHIWLGGYPALLKDVLGLQVEEWQPLCPSETITLQDTEGRQWQGSHWAEVIRVDGAEVLARITNGWMDGQPVICRHAFGSGRAYYVATRPEPAHLNELLHRICAEQGVYPVVDAPIGVEAMVRASGDTFHLFIINHTDRTAVVQLGMGGGTDTLTGETVRGEVRLEPYGVQVVLLRTETHKEMRVLDRL
jgi:beta-galactosidase